MDLVSELLTEREFRRVLGLWYLETRLGECCTGTEEDYIDSFRIPDVNYVHTQSFADINGDLISLLKAEIHLADWETRTFRQGGAKFVFYKVLRTFADTPEAEPDEMGYIVI